MKYIILTLFSAIVSLSATAQQVLTNHILFEIDDAYADIDTVTANRGFHVIDVFSCVGDSFNNDSCVHSVRYNLDSAGRLVGFIRGGDLAKKEIDFQFQCKKLSDTSYEMHLEYPPGSKMISDVFFIDTVIKEKSRHLPLYKYDKKGNLVIRSLYYPCKNNELKIERYDLNNKLVQISYPFWKSDTKSEWDDSVTTDLHKTVKYHSQHPEGKFTWGNVLSRDGRLLEIYYVNQGADSLDFNISKTMYVYDTAANPILKINLDKNNTFLSEDRFTYNGKNLVKHTTDYDLFDNDINEEKVWDEKGRLIMERSRPFFSLIATETTWKYFYRPDGLKDREVLYENGTLKATKFYRYK